MKEARDAWRELRKSFDPAKVIFLDETGAADNMARRYGRCRRGERLVCKIPHGHWKTTTLVAGLTLQGIVAPAVFDGPMDGQTFKAYAGQELAKVLGPGSLVVMDNLSSHKVEGIRQIIEAKGATLLYLPPYSPDLNPIEQAFSKLKALLRKAAERSVEALWNAIGRIVGLYSPDECKNYFRNAGYN